MKKFIKPAYTGIAIEKTDPDMSRLDAKNISNATIDSWEDGELLFQRSDGEIFFLTPQQLAEQGYTNTSGNAWTQGESSSLEFLELVGNDVNLLKLYTTAGATHSQQNRADGGGLAVINGERSLVTTEALILADGWQADE